MAQEDYVVDNGTGLAVRTDLNKQFQAIVTQNSGAAAPVTTYPGMLWLDLSDPTAPDGVLRMRNQANSAWLSYFANQPQFDALQAQVDANRADIDDHEQRIVVLEADVLDMRADIGGNTSSITQLQADVGTLATRVTNVETKNTQQDTSIGSLSTRMTTAETNIGNLQNSVNANTGNIATLTNRVTAAEGVNTTQGNDITAIQTKNTQQDGSISSIDTRVTTLEQASGTGAGAQTVAGGHYVGEVFYVPYGTPPVGCIKANGAALSRTTYKELFDKIGTTYGVGDGSTTFNVPDLRGEFIRGWDDGRGVDTGRPLGSSQSQLMPNHAHALPMSSDTGQFYSVQVAGGAGPLYGTTGGTNVPGRVISQGALTSYPNFGIALSSATLFSQTGENRPRNVAMMAVICYKSGAGGLFVTGGVRTLGEVFYVSAQSSIPDDCVKANGQAISRTDYADYFALVGTTFGSGDGSTTFNVPDLRGEFIRGFDEGRNVDTGRAFGSAQTDALQNFTGTFIGGGPNAGTGGAFAIQQMDTGDYLMGPTGAQNRQDTIVLDPSRVARTATETRPRNVAMLALVCVRRQQIVGSGMVQQLIAQGDVVANAVGSIITLDVPAGMDTLDLILNGIVPTVDASGIGVQFSTDGTTWIGSGGPAGYNTTYVTTKTGSGTPTGAGFTDQGWFIIANPYLAKTAAYSINLRFNNLSTNGRSKHASWTGTGVQFDGQLTNVRGSGSGDTAAFLPPIKKIRFFVYTGAGVASPAAAGTYQWLGYGRYTVPGSGDVVAGKDMTMPHSVLRLAVNLNNEHSAAYLRFDASTQNAPAAVPGIVEVLPTNNDDKAPTAAGDWTVQRALTTENPPRTWVRRYDGGTLTWSGWTPYATSTDAFVSVEQYRQSGFTDAQTIQAAVNAGVALDFPDRTYTVNAGETVLNDLCHCMRFNNTVLRIGDGAIANTDANRTNHTAFMRVRGVQGFAMLGQFTVDGNRDMQTYPATTSDFGRGAGSIGSAGRRTNGIIEFTPATNNATPARAIFIENAIVRNAYLNGLVFWQTEGVTINSIRTSNNTVNGIAGGGVTDFYVNNPRHYRDGASDAFPTTRTPTGYGDRAGIQLREIPTNFNAAALGMPMIPVSSYGQINRNVIIKGGTAEECGVESWFLRGCFPAKLVNCVSRNVGYKRLSGTDSGGVPFFPPAHFWCEFGHYDVDVVAYQDVATQAGWMSPMLGVCYSFTGNGYTSTVNPLAIAGDFKSTVKAKGYCGLTSAGAKQNNFSKGVLLSSMVDADIEIEGASDDPITITNDTNFNTQPPHDVDLRAVVANAMADRAVMIQRYQPTGVTVAGTANDIRIHSLKATDIRSTKTGTDDHAIVDVDTTMGTYLLDNFEARDLVMDGTNTGGNFNGVRLRCNAASKNIHVNFKRGLNLFNALRTQGFRNLKLDGMVESCNRAWLVDFSTSGVDTDEFDFSGLKTVDTIAEMFLIMNAGARKFKTVRASGALLKGRTTCKTWGTNSITTTPDNFAQELGTFYWDRVTHDFGSANAANVQDMRRRFASAAALAAAVPFYPGEIVLRTDTSGAYVARSTAAGDFSLMA